MKLTDQLINILIDLCIIGIILGFFTNKIIFIISIAALLLIHTIEKNNRKEISINKIDSAIYKPKKFLTNNEYSFYLKLKELESYGYVIIPQINLASIIEKTNSTYRTELFRNIDFGIFDQELNLKILIELNDKTHAESKRRDRDLKVKKILDTCNINLLNFYTSYPNEKDYVINRILNSLKASKTQNN